MEKARKIYVPIPRPDVYYGIRVNQDTKIEFKNDFITQKIENLILYTEQKIEKDEFKAYTKTELKLQENDLLLLEEENRGYFKPKDIKFGSIDEALEEMNFIKEQIEKCEV